MSQGDLGISFQNDRDVSQIIRDTFFVTAQLGVLAFLLAVIVGLTLGTLSALNHNGPLDYVGVGFATIGASVPNFILASFLVVFLAVGLGWFGTIGWGGPHSVSAAFNPAHYHLKTMVLPVVSIQGYSMRMLVQNPATISEGLPPLPLLQGEPAGGVGRAYGSRVSVPQ